MRDKFTSSDTWTLEENLLIAKVLLFGHVLSTIVIISETEFEKACHDAARGSMKEQPEGRCCGRDKITGWSEYVRGHTTDVRQLIHNDIK